MTKKKPHGGPRVPDHIQYKLDLSPAAVGLTTEQVYACAYNYAVGLAPYEDAVRRLARLIGSPKKPEYAKARQVLIYCGLEHPREWKPRCPFREELRKQLKRLRMTAKRRGIPYRYMILALTRGLTDDDLNDLINDYVEEWRDKMPLNLLASLARHEENLPVLNPAQASFPITRKAKPFKKRRPNKPRRQK
jgi:hypothetical protein